MTRSLTAGVAAVAVAASALVAPTASAQAAGETAAITGGSFVWPIKESFLAYPLSTFAKGKVTPSDGATLVDGGKAISFPVDAADSYLDSKGNGTIELDGAFEALAHPEQGPNGEWGMDVKIDDVKLKITDGTKVSIVVDYDSYGAAGAKGAAVIDAEGDDEVLSTFVLEQAIIPKANSEVKIADRPTTLTKVASPALASFYDRFIGQELEDGDADLNLTFGKVIDEQGAPDPKPNPGTEETSSTGAIVGIVLGVIALLGALGAAGAAFAGLIPGVKIPGL